LEASLHNAPDVWYLRYRDNTGRLCKAKLTTEQLHKRLGEGRFAGDVEASHNHGGEFKPLGSFAELAPALAVAQKARRLRVPPRGPHKVTAAQKAITPRLSKSRLWLYSALGAAAMIVATAIVMVLLSL
jgi:hypothetical protein